MGISAWVLESLKRSTLAAKAASGKLALNAGLKARTTRSMLCLEPGGELRTAVSLKLKPDG